MSTFSANSLRRLTASAVLSLCVWLRRAQRTTEIMVRGKCEGLGKMRAVSNWGCSRDNMGIVRPFFEEDIPQVAELRRRVHGTSAQWLDWYELFLSNPFIDAALPALVYEEGDGKIVGFLGVMPRWMLLHGQPVRVAISTHFMVDSAKRGLAG